MTPIESFPTAYGFDVVHATAQDGTRLRIVVAGASNTRRVVCLHGFPQNAAAWRKVAGMLAEDFQVVMPDLRGFGASDLAASGRYDLDTVAADVTRVIERTSHGAEPKVVLVTHDWGGPVGWHFLGRAGALVHHHVCVNGPHLLAYAKELVTDPKQRKGGWYTAMFQLPGIEHLLAAGGGQGLAKTLVRSSKPGTFSEEDIALYIEPLASDVRRMRAGLAYYRAGLSWLASPRHRGESARIETPTTIVWGMRDVAIRPSVLERMLREVCPAATVRRLPTGTHWLPDESPEEIAVAVRAAWATPRDPGTT